MSVSLGKLNRPGLGANTLGGSKGIAQQATRNLSNTTAASKTSVFSFGKSRSGNWVKGQNAIKGHNQVDYSRRRAAMRQPAPMGPSGSVNVFAGGQMNHVSGMNSFQKGMVYGQIAMAGLNLLNQMGVFGGKKAAPISNGNQLTGAMAGLGGTPTAITLNSAEAQSVLSRMNSATNSADLRSAISDAKNTHTEMQAKLKDSEADFKNAQQNVGKLTDEVAGMKEEERTQLGQVQEKEGAIKACEAKLEGLKPEYANAIKDEEKATAAVSEAESNKTQADQNVQDATVNLTNAEQNLNQIKRLPDDTPGKAAKVAEAEAKVEDAKTKHSAALEKQKEAEEKLNQAKTDKEAATKKKTELQKNITTNKEEIQKAETQRSKAKDDLKKLQENVKETQTKISEKTKELEKANDVIEKFKSDSMDANGLSGAITQYEKKLTDMEKTEQKQYEKDQKQIKKETKRNDKLLGKIDASDGMSKKEIKRLNEIQNNNRDLGALNNDAAMLENSVMQTQLSKTPAETDGDGNEYRQTVFKGKTYYSKNNKLITEAEYNARNQEN